MLIYPPLNPIAFHLGPLPVHWYGLMYLGGFLTAWFLAELRAKNDPKQWNSARISDLVFYCALGVIIGGRTGYMLFYDLSEWLANPLLLFKTWEGGMSFHGGLLGVAVALWVFSLRYNYRFFVVSDFVAPLVPIGLGLGRIGNFINGELWGRPTELPWGMLFPHAGPWPRHPSQLYELATEGILLFFIMWFYTAKSRPTMAPTGLFLMVYGLFRIMIESFREPDPQIGFLAFDWLTIGQLLSLPMVIIGASLFIYAYVDPIRCSKKRI